MTGYPENSKVSVTLRDGSVLDNPAWSEISERTTVKYFDQTKTVYLCTLPVASVEIRLNDLFASVDISEGDQVYISIRSEMFAAQDISTNTVVGKTVGIVRDGVVVEEKYINALENRVEGFRN